MSKYDHTPEKEVKKNRYDYLNDMETEKLNVLLQQESFLSTDDSYDVDLIRQIMDVLDKREPVLEDLDAEASLRTFREEILPGLEHDEIRCMVKPTPQQLIIRRRKLTLRYVLVAAILATLLGSTIIASAFGFNLWEYVIRWGKHAFMIGEVVDVTAGPESGIPPSDVGLSIAEMKTYKSACDTIADYEIPIRFPKWLPESFIFTQGEISDIPQRKSMSLLYKSDDKILMFNVITYQTSEDAAYSFEKNDGDGTTLVIGDVEHYLMKNEDQYQAVWIIDKSVYSINANVTEDEIIKIIQSMYEE